MVARWFALLPLVLGVALAPLAPARLRAPQSLPSAREWNQPQGNGAGTGAIDVAPLKSPPKELWRVTDVVVAPVVTQAKLFVVARAGGALTLKALEPASGKVVAEAALAGVLAPLALAASDGTVAVIEANALHLWRLAGSELALVKSVSGSFTGAPSVVGGLLFVPRAEGGVQQVDWSSGKVAPAIAAGFGRASGLDDDLAGGKPVRSLLLVQEDEKKGEFALKRSTFAVGATPPKFAALETVASGPRVATEAGRPATVLMAVQGRERLEWYAWYGGAEEGGLLAKDGWQTLPFRAPPAARNGHLFGFDRLERLVDHDVANRGSTPLVTKEALLPGAKQGEPSIARDALFLGNWAIDLNHRRVLWCLPEIDPVGPALPIGDALLAIRTRDGALIGYGAGAAATTAGSGAKAGRPARPATLELPGKQPGLVRVDGWFFAGKPTESGATIRLEPAGGGPVQELAVAEVALIDPGDAAKRLGEEHPLYLACWRAVSSRHADRLVACFEQYREAKLIDDCKRLAEELARLSFDQGRLDELNGSIAGKATAKGGAVAAAKKKCAEAEAEARVDSSDEIVTRAKWCARIGAPTAATVLLKRAKEAAPKVAIEDEADFLIDWRPASFPEEALAKAPVKEWAQWADALLPSGAVFAKLDDSQERRLSVTKFASGALSLRTKNILLYTKEFDPKVLGPLLARGEATIRALQLILGESPDRLSPNVPLEVRLYQERADYLADSSTPPEWSAGCYSPNDGLSRFYSKQSGDEKDPLAHTLQEVFAHELTHHYCDRRWVREKHTGGGGSYWMVEGFAEFVAGQALEIGRLGDAFDDPTVEAIDRAAAAARAEQLIPLEFLLQIDRKLFHSELEGGQFGPVRLRHTLKEAFLDKRGVFYAEATALTFFVMNHCNDGRAIYRRWLHEVYSGKALVEPWKDLGFADVYAMRKAFREFLDSI
ncbi:MAG: hypothetical protein JNL90_09215 [Planctomycetes bacterium]|nr:hypothetical protein [Planctomycetota bacterium]